ncbi:hypothetical protein BDK51DRAFT_19876, partial [Blyttiomyces helicus]
DPRYLLFQGRLAPPVISRTRPALPRRADTIPSTAPLPVVVMEIEDTDILKFISGGLTGLKAFTTNRVRIHGDLILAQQLEEVFIRTGGVEKAMAFLEKATGLKMEPVPRRTKKSKL